ncbi:hypothetical protein HYE67_009789 [Fusarium culmorum]|uniref:Uncharacterized protein n=1 Tax=Fusarium culmorum TaxID=5516 RepID=A0A7S8DFE1_FUSCU|nr:hypothetical protein HYE67_009789 [Fusarium culmorum]
MKKELEFLEATKREYGLEVGLDEPRPATKSFVDIFNSASCASATLLEGMVLLWAVEILFFTSILQLAVECIAKCIQWPGDT